MAMPLAQTALSPPPGGSRDAFTMDFHGNRKTRVLRLPLCTRLTQRALVVVVVVCVFVWGGVGGWEGEGRGGREGRECVWEEGREGVGWVGWGGVG